VLSTRPNIDLVVDVTDEQVAAFHERGFLAIEQITVEEELDWLRQAFDTLFARRTGFTDGVFDLTRPYGADGEPQLGQLLRPERLLPEVRETAMWRNARAVAGRLLGQDVGALDSWGHLIAKAPRHGAVTPWHQDEAYWDPTLDYNAVGAWAPLDDATVANGCLWFLPGSHRGEVLPHRHLDDDPNIHVLLTSVEIDTSTAIAVPVAAGGATFHHQRTLHYAGPNETDHPRRVWANEFQTSPVPRQVAAHRPWVTAGHRAVPTDSIRPTTPRGTP
jgi:ectoine hydroxylase-related dioxygenase (phytanoyl-CoA dioxygenase family)